MSITTDRVTADLAEVLDHSGLIPMAKRAEEPAPPPRVKVYRMWITPEGLAGFPLPVEALSLAEAIESATKAAPLCPQVGNRPFTVSGRQA
jgi:hypothetical protein